MLLSRASRPQTQEVEREGGARLEFECHEFFEGEESLRLEQRGEPEKNCDCGTARLTLSSAEIKEADSDGKKAVMPGFQLTPGSIQLAKSSQPLPYRPGELNTTFNPTMASATTRETSIPVSNWTRVTFGGGHRRLTLHAPLWVECGKEAGSSESVRVYPSRDEYLARQRALTPSDTAVLHPCCCYLHRNSCSYLSRLES